MLLGISARPRGNEWLENEIKNFSMKGINHLVSLLENTEITVLRVSVVRHSEVSECGPPPRTFKNGLSQEYLYNFRFA